MDVGTTSDRVIRRDPSKELHDELRTEGKMMPALWTSGRRESRTCPGHLRSKFILREIRVEAKQNVKGKWQIIGVTQSRVLMRLMIFLCDFILPVMPGEENKATLLELGAVEPLTKLLTHEDKIVRRNATMIFGILASNSK